MVDLVQGQVIVLEIPEVQVVARMQEQIVGTSSVESPEVQAVAWIHE